MKTYKTTMRHNPVTTLVRHTCDICKRDMSCGVGFYEKNEVTLTHLVGHVYPEGGNLTEYSLDICGDCFIKKVRPLIEDKFKVKMHEEDKSW